MKVYITCRYYQLIHGGSKEETFAGLLEIKVLHCPPLAACRASQRPRLGNLSCEGSENASKNAGIVGAGARAIWMTMVDG